MCVGGGGGSNVLDPWEKNCFLPSLTLFSSQAMLYSTTTDLCKTLNNMIEGGDHLSAKERHSRLANKKLCSASRKRWICVTAGEGFRHIYSCIFNYSGYPVSDRLTKRTIPEYGPPFFSHKYFPIHIIIRFRKRTDPRFGTRTTLFQSQIIKGLEKRTSKKKIHTLQL